MSMFNNVIVNHFKPLHFQTYKRYMTANLRLTCATPLLQNPDQNSVLSSHQIIKLFERNKTVS